MSSLLTRANAIANVVGQYLPLLFVVPLFFISQDLITMLFWLPGMLCSVWAFFSIIVRTVRIVRYHAQPEKIDYVRAQKQKLIAPTIIVFMFGAAWWAQDLSQQSANTFALEMATEIQAECVENALCPRELSGWEPWFGSTSTIHVMYGRYGTKYPVRYTPSDDRTSFELNVRHNIDEGLFIEGGVYTPLSATATAPDGNTSVEVDGLAPVEKAVAPETDAFSVVIENVRYRIVLDEQFYQSVDIKNRNDKALVELLRNKVRAAVAEYTGTLAYATSLPWFFINDQNEFVVRVEYEKDFADAPGYEGSITALVYGLSQLFDPDCSYYCAPEHPITIQAACATGYFKGSDQGYGYESFYYGTVTPALLVDATLSCDLMKLDLRITNPDGQYITSQQITMYDQGGDDLATNRGESVSFTKDFNFDGYNDLQATYVMGSEVSWSHIYLFDPETNTFVYHEALSALPNITVEHDQVLERTGGSWGSGFLESKDTYYRWSDDTILPTFSVACLTRDLNGGLDSSIKEKIAVVTYDNFDSMGILLQPAQVTLANGDGCYALDLQSELSANTEATLDFLRQNIPRGFSGRHIEWVMEGTSIAPVFLFESSSEIYGVSELAELRTMLAQEAVESETYMWPERAGDFLYTDRVYVHYERLHESQTDLSALYMIDSFMGANAATAFVITVTDSAVWPAQLPYCAQPENLSAITLDHYWHSHKILATITDCSHETFTADSVVYESRDLINADFEPISFPQDLVPTGRYRAEHYNDLYKTMVETGPEWIQAAHGTSTLAVNGAPGGVDFDIAINEGHVCSLSGFAASTKRDDTFVFTELVSEGKVCTLFFVQNPDGTVTIKDQDSVCKRSSCGPAASYNKEFLIVESF